MTKKLLPIISISDGCRICTCSVHNPHRKHPSLTEAPVAEAPATEAPPHRSPRCCRRKFYYLNFKPEVAEIYAKIADAYKAETGVTLKVVTAASGTYEQTLKSEIAKGRCACPVPNQRSCRLCSLERLHCRFERHRTVQTSFRQKHGGHRW